MKIVCGAKKKDGSSCQKSPIDGSNRCRLHGGATPRAANSPNFKHGLYSKYAPQQIQDKIDDYIEADPLDLTHELALTRALLAEWMSRYKDGIRLDMLGVDVLTNLIASVRRTVESISKIKNETALTAAEITYLQVRAVDVALKYFPDDQERQDKFITDLFTVDSSTITNYQRFIKEQSATITD